MVDYKLNSNIISPAVGIKGYDSTVTYNLNDVVLNVNNSAIKLYLSLSANNNYPLTNTGKWKAVSLGGGSELGDIGLAPFGIDESLNLRRYLNGQVILQSQFAPFTTKLKARVALYSSLATTEVNWQAEVTNSVLGQCGKFVIDDENGTIRLPKVINAQGLTDLQYLGTLKSESLPNITGSITSENSLSWNKVVTGEGALFGNNTTASCANANGVSGSRTTQFSLDASLSSSTYQNNAPVQQEAIQYPYYIQVATDVEEQLPAIREYKTNVPYVLGDSRYFEASPYNASWLVSNGQYNAKSVYPDMWTQLQVELNNSLNEGDTIIIDGKTYVKRGLPVVLSTGTITDYDFVVNQSDETFRLPLLNGEEDIPNYSMAYALSNTGTITINKNGWVNYTGIRTNAIGAVTVSGVLFQSGSSAANDRGSIMIPVYKGDTVTGTGGSDTSYFIPAVGNGSLYYYVGDILQDASLINAGAILNDVANLKAMRHITETYLNGADWYRVWSDGWVEQGGLIYYADGSGRRTVNFLKPFNMSGNPNIQITICASTYNSAAALKNTCNAQTRSDTGFKTYVDANAPIKYWVACGKGA